MPALFLLVPVLSLGSPEDTQGPEDTGGTSRTFSFRSLSSITPKPPTQTVEGMVAIFPLLFLKRKKWEEGRGQS